MNTSIQTASLSNIVNDLLTNKESENPSMMIEGIELIPSMLNISNVGVDSVPEELLSSFVFRDEFAVQPKAQYQAGSITISILAMRLGAEGEVLQASPSIKNAAYGVQSDFSMLGEPNKKAVIKPDLFVEGCFYTTVDGDITVAVPSVMKKPYPEVSAPVSMGLTDVTPKQEKASVRWNTARNEFTKRLQLVSKELGVPCGQQFLVCVVGYPSMSMEIKAEGYDTPAYGVAFPEGGYILGGMKVSAKRSKLAPGLQSLAVTPDMKLSGGRSLTDLLSREMLKPKTRQPVPVRVASAPASTPVELAVPSSTSTVPVVPAVPVVSDEPKKVSLLEKLGRPTVSNRFDLSTDEDFDDDDYEEPSSLEAKMKMDNTISDPFGA